MLNFCSLEFQNNSHVALGRVASKEKKRRERERESNRTELTKKGKPLSRALKPLAQEKDLRRWVGKRIAISNKREKMGLRYMQEGLTEIRASDTLESL